MLNRLYGIVLSSHDYKEKDKLVDLLTAEQGLIRVLVKGVKQPNAKLKYAKEFLTFGYYDIANKQNNNTLTSCEVIDDFSGIRNSPDKFFEAGNIVKIALTVVKYSENNSAILIELLTALKELNYSNIKSNYVFLKFLIKSFEFFGYKLNFDKCSNCGLGFYGKKFLNTENGEIVCSACALPYYTEISDAVFTNLRIISATNYDKLITLNLKQIEKLISLLELNFKKFNKDIKFYL